MTLPTPPPPVDGSEVIPTIIDAGMQGLVQNASRLGLTWTMTMATITKGDDPANVLALCDGDTGPILMKSMIGAITATTRVYVIQVPPGTNYVAGIAGLQSDFEWRDYTPLTSNVTLGTGGTTIGQYLVRGHTVDFFIRTTLGTSGVFGTDPRWELPFTMDSTWGIAGVAQVMMLDTSAGATYPGLGRTSSTQVIPRALSNSAGAISALLNASTPFIWAVGDSIDLMGRYRAEYPLVPRF